MEKLNGNNLFAYNSRSDACHGACHFTMISFHLQSFLSKNILYCKKYKRKWKIGKIKNKSVPRNALSDLSVVFIL